MTRTSTFWSTLGLASLVFTACAGELTAEEETELRAQIARHRGAAGASNVAATSAATTTGAGGSGNDAAACVIALGEGPKCNLCHADATKIAGLVLNRATIANGRQLWLDKPGQGEPPGMMLACGAPENASLKLIDSLSPEKSLFYTKLSVPAPCGEKMPYGPGMATAAEKECVLGWVKTFAANGN